MKLSSCQSLTRVNNSVYSNNDNVQPSTNCAHTHSNQDTAEPTYRKQVHQILCTPCLPSVGADKRDSVCELLSFFMSISISAGALFEWNFVNGAHSFQSCTSRSNRARNASAGLACSLWKDTLVWLFDILMQLRQKELIIYCCAEWDDMQIIHVQKIWPH